jgi:hypothetical protein
MVSSIPHLMTIVPFVMAPANALKTRMMTGTYAQVKTATR